MYPSVRLCLCPTCISRSSCICLSLSSCLASNISVSRSIFFFIHPTVCLCLYLSTYLNFSRSSCNCPSLYMSVKQSLCLSAYLFLYPLNCWYVSPPLMSAPASPCSPQTSLNADALEEPWDLNIKSHQNKVNDKA